MESLCSSGLSEGDSAASCLVESGSFSVGGSFASDGGVLVLQYNVNYNGLGGEGLEGKQDGLDGIEEMIRKVDPDVVMLSEVERGCGDRYESGAEELARRLELNFAYAVEFVKKPFTRQGSNVTECTTGNAILSRYKVRNLKYTQFASQCCAYPGRAAGRSALSAVIILDEEQTLCVHSTHLESGSESEILPAIFVRGEQAAQLSHIAKTYASENSCSASVIGGDLNAPFRQMDLVALAFAFNGFVDAHANLAPNARQTLEGNAKSSFHNALGLGTLDYIYVSPSTAIVDGASGVCHDEQVCHGWSDHVAVWSGLNLLRNGSDGVVLHRATLQNLAVPRSADMPASNWLWADSLFVWPFIMIHSLLAYRRYRRADRVATAGYVASWRESLGLFQSSFLGRTLAHWLYSCSLLIFLSVLLTATGAAPLWRDFGIWVLFMTQCFLVLVHSPLSSAKNWILVVLLDTIATCACSSAIVFFALTFPIALAQSSFPATVLAFLACVNTIQPAYVIIMLRKYRPPIHTEQFAWAGLGASIFLVAFLTLDWSWSGADCSQTNPFAGWALFAPDLILSALSWALALAFQFLLGAGLRILLSPLQLVSHHQVRHPTK